jgi:hypothetical protein
MPAPPAAMSAPAAAVSAVATAPPAILPGYPAAVYPGRPDAAAALATAPSPRDHREDRGDHRGDYRKKCQHADEGEGRVTHQHTPGRVQDVSVAATDSRRDPFVAVAAPVCARG